MSEFEDKINAILGNPAEMEKITKLAAQLMAGAARRPLRRKRRRNHRGKAQRKRRGLISEALIRSCSGK